MLAVGPRAFRGLFARWAERLLHFLFRMVGDRAVAEERVQDTLLRAHGGSDRHLAERETR